MEYERCPGTGRTSRNVDVSFWIALEFAIIAVAVLWWLLVNYLIVRFALPSEPPGVRRASFAALIVGSNLGFLGIFAYQGSQLLGKMGLIHNAAVTESVLGTVQNILVTAGLVCVILGGSIWVGALAHRTNGRR